MPGVDEVYTTACTGQLEINGITLIGPAWAVLDLTQLWFVGTRRGSDVVIPGVSGVKSFVRRYTATRVDLAMAIVGTVNSLGVTNEDPWLGLQENVDYLRTNLIDAMELRPATLTMPDATERTADVQVEDFVLGQHTGRAQYMAVLSITLPAGPFA